MVHGVDRMVLKPLWLLSLVLGVVDLDILNLVVLEVLLRDKLMLLMFRQFRSQ